MTTALLSNGGPPLEDDVSHTPPWGFAGGPAEPDEKLQWSFSRQEGHESYARMAGALAAISNGFAADPRSG